MSGFGEFITWDISAHGSLMQVFADHTMHHEVVLPDNVIVIMQCHNDVVRTNAKCDRQTSNVMQLQGFGSTIDKILYSDNHFMKQVQKGEHQEVFIKLLFFNRYMEYLQLYFKPIVDVSAATNKFCVYTNKCPQVSFSSSVQEAQVIRSGVTRLGASAKTRSKSVDDNTLSAFIDNTCASTRGREKDFHVIIVNTCASTEFNPNPIPKFEGAMSEIINTLETRNVILKKFDTFTASALHNLYTYTDDIVVAMATRQNDDAMMLDGGKPKIRILGRMRVIIKVGRKQMVKYKGQLISVHEAKKLEKNKKQPA